MIKRIDTKWLFLVLVVLLGSMAYNNYMVFHRKYFTVLYFIGAIVCMIIFGGMIIGS